MRYFTSPVKMFELSQVYIQPSLPHKTNKYHLKINDSTDIHAYTCS